MAGGAPTVFTLVVLVKLTVVGIRHPPWLLLVNDTCGLAFICSVVDPLFVQPKLLVTIDVATMLPPLSYVWEVVEPVAPLPSPKSQLMLEMLPSPAVDWSVNVTFSGVQLVTGEVAKATVGLLYTLTTCWVELTCPLGKVTVSVTVKLPGRLKERVGFHNVDVAPPSPKSQEAEPTGLD